MSFLNNLTFNIYRKGDLDPYERGILLREWKANNKRTSAKDLFKNNFRKESRVSFQQSAARLV